MKHIEFRYAIQSFEDFYLVNSQRGPSLKSRSEFSQKEEFFSSLLIFPSPEEAEEFIWKHSLLNVNVTLRPVLL